MTAPFTTNTTSTALLNAAQFAAAKAFDGQPATRDMLDHLAARVKANILTQVALGEWASLGVVDPDDFGALRVSAALGKAWLGEPQIKITYDFTHTTKPALMVETVRGDGAS